MFTNDELNILIDAMESHNGILESWIREKLDWNEDCTSDEADLEMSKELLNKLKAMSSRH